MLRLREQLSRCIYERELIMSLKKVLKFLSSMQFAVILLVLLALACIAGSFITQAQTLSWYTQMYGERRAAMIIALGLDDAYHSWWFILISGFLCLNLLFCNVVRLPQLIERTKNAKDPEKIIRLPHTHKIEGVQNLESIEKGLRLPAGQTIQNEEGKEVKVYTKNTIGIWGAWVCHIGVLLLIAGFSLGQMTKKEYTVYGVPGQIKEVADTGYAIEIDDFQTLYNKDGSLDQYVTKLTMMDIKNPDDKTTAEVTVNGPASMYGYRIYQNSTGWASTVSITKDEEPLQEYFLCSGEYVPVKDKPELLIYLNNVYPSLGYTADGMPTSISDEPDNPGYLYTVYYMGEILGMNVLTGDDKLTIDEYTVTFSDPQRYTLVQVKKDSFAWLAFLGGMITMVGLLLAFYLQQSSVWAVKEADGYTVYGYSPKGGVLFKEMMEEAVHKDKEGEK